MRTCYIAGSMSGIPEFNRPAFFAEADFLSSDFVVLNPATLPAGLTQGQYMDICFAMVRAAEVVFMLPGWRESEGAVAEYHYAKKLGHLIREIE